ncbi:Intercellular adhesion molecule 5, partial [Galemys pyrenaicus]
DPHACWSHISRRSLVRLGDTVRSLPRPTMAPGATRLALPVLLALLRALLAGAEVAGISVYPQSVIIPQGGSVQVNCSASCDSLGLETQLTKKELTHGNNWKLFLLSDVHENSNPICFSNCAGGQLTAVMLLSVYCGQLVQLTQHSPPHLYLLAFPELVDLAPLPPWQPVGKNLTLHCKVVGGVPQALLTVVLLQGEEELTRQPAVGKTTEVTFTLVARREDHGANFSCRTELDLRHHGLGLLENSSASRLLQTFDLPQTLPSLITPKVVEVGTEWSVNCCLEGLFPASEAEVHLVLGYQQLDPKIKHNESSICAWVQVKLEEKNVHQLMCTVGLGDQRRVKAEEVTVYSFPAPSLTLSPSTTISEGENVTVECKAQAGILVMLNETDPQNSTVQLTLTTTAEDNKRNFNCSAKLVVAGEPRYKHQTQELRVLYGPRLDEKDCLGNWTWQEGSHQNLSCQPWGNPTPTLECLRKEDKALLPIGELRPVKYEIQGTYKCVAQSSQGRVSRDVFVNVICECASGGAGQGWGRDRESSSTLTASSNLLTDHRNDGVIIAVVLALVLIAAVGTAAYLYNRQRKIRKYKLQEAQKEFTAVPPGGSVWLNCSSSCPLPEVSSLRTLLLRGKTLSGRGWVAYQLLDVTAWSSDVHCFVTCAGETRGATARITTYKVPRSVILEPPVLEGSEYTLRCHVTHVFPVGLLVVTLRRGGRVIYSESLERFTRLDLANVTLTYVLPTKPRDFWLPVTCHARLNLDGLVIRSSSAPMTLTASGPSPGLRRALLGLWAALGLGFVGFSAVAQEPFWADLQPRVALVERGGSLWLNCSTNCPRPERGGLETSLRRNGTQRGLRWLARQLVDIREPETQPVCFFRCARRTLQARGLIRTFQRPDRVELVPLPAWQPVGENFTVSCRVPGAGPRGSLTLTLLRGGQELIRRSFAGEPPRARGAVLTATVLARREDHRANFSCRAELDLRPHGLGLFENSSAPRELRTFALSPDPPRLTVPRLLEVDLESPVSCTLDGLFPASEAQVYLALGDQRLSPEVTVDGDVLMATATATASAEQEGPRELVCNVTLGGKSRETRENLTVYSFPAPYLTLSEPSVPEGEMVTVTCAAGARALVTLDGLPATALGQPVQLQLNATENDDRRSFFCDATLEVDGETLSKNKSAELQVLYAPRLDDSDCPRSWTWPEGPEQTLRCEARGNPAPSVHCVRPDSGAVLALGLLGPVTRALAGTYQCTATNNQGAAVKEVTLTVEYAPALDSVGCPERITWLEGTEASLSCVAQGFPPPSVSCTRSGEVIEGLLRVARQHAGTYSCEAINARGSAVKNVAVTVEYGPSFEELSCPSNWTWVEGSGQPFSCEVDGKPEPTVECIGSGGISEGVLLPLAPPDPSPRAPSISSDLAPGIYICNATNAHGSMVKTVAVSAESPPQMDESTCPSHQTWLEGTEAATLTCTARGRPSPQVLCSREGASQPQKLRVSREDAGTYRCLATNAHGTDARVVTVGVEYRPVVAELAASPPGGVRPGGNFTLTCRAEAWPPAQISWRAPPGAPNIGLSSNNSTLSVAGAMGSHGGEYECAATNAHGRHARRITVRVAGPWLWVAVGGAAGGAVLLAAGAGLAFYVQSTACKKGEYNVQEAESSGEAVCLNGAGGGAGGSTGTEGVTEAAGNAEAPSGGEVFTIQLTSA